MTSLTRIKQIALAAENLDESTAFYRDILGATLMARYDPPGLVFFDFDGTRLLLEHGATRGTLYFQVADIDQSFVELTAQGVEFERPPHLIFPDQAGTFGPRGEAEWMAFFKDPAGNLLAIASRKTI